MCRSERRVLGSGPACTLFDGLSKPRADSLYRFLPGCRDQSENGAGPCGGPGWPRNVTGFKASVRSDGCHDQAGSSNPHHPGASSEIPSHGANLLTGAASRNAQRVRSATRVMRPPAEAAIFSHLPPVNDLRPPRVLALRTPPYAAMRYAAIIEDLAGGPCDEDANLACKNC